MADDMPLELRPLPDPRVEEIHKRVCEKEKQIDEERRRMEHIFAHIAPTNQMHHGTFDRNRPVPGAARFSAKSTLRCVRQPTGPFILPKKAAERHRRMKEAEGEADSEPSEETPARTATTREEPASGAASAASVSRPEETEDERLERVARERARKRVMKSLGIKPQGEKGKDDPAKHDHLWAFQRFNTTTSQDVCTEYQRGFMNDEDMQEEMRHVDATHHLKRNAFTDYTEAVMRTKGMMGGKSRG